MDPLHPKMGQTLICKAWGLEESNAGMTDSWEWQLLSDIRTDMFAETHFYHYPESTLESTNGEQS